MKHRVRAGINRVFRKVKEKSPTILTGVAVVGVVATSVSVATATPKALEILEMSKEQNYTKLETIVEVAPVYIPSVMLGVTTAACIIAANVISQKQQAQITSAYYMLGKAYKDYRSTVKELLGEDSDKEIVDTIAKKRYEQSKEDISVASDDEQLLWYESISGQWFYATEREVMIAEYHTNRNFAINGWIKFNEFCDFLNIPHYKEAGDIIGWDRYSGEAFYGYSFIDFEHRHLETADGKPFVRIDYPFGPHLEDGEECDYLEYNS